jgi:hypothetical protein
MKDKDRAALLWATTEDTNPPLDFPPIRMPWKLLAGTIGLIITVVLFPVVVIIMVLVWQVLSALSRKTRGTKWISGS